jgi:hypothetical protein
MGMCALKKQKAKRNQNKNPAVESYLGEEEEKEKDGGRGMEQEPSN